MENPSSSYKISFNKLTNLFIRECEHIWILKPDLGEGYVQIFTLEKGFQARFWDCSFKQGIEMYNKASSGVDTYFTLVFFLNAPGLGFANGDTLLKGNIFWDTFFFSAKSNYKIHISPNMNGQCLSISFSKKWLSTNVLEGNDELKNIKEKIGIIESFSLFESMNFAEKKLVQELLTISWKIYFGSFYIKSVVLKIISDFFCKIKERETFNISNIYLDTTINKVEDFLISHLTDRLPNLKDLAARFCISESTLKRHFKNRYGVNISTYFMQRKIEYALHLIQEKKMNITEAAYLLGYRNVNYFIAILKKHGGYI